MSSPPVDPNLPLYGIAGTNPLSDLDNFIDDKLKDAVKAVWDEYADKILVTSNPETWAPYPAATKILFNTTWYDNHRDMTISFRKAPASMPTNERSTDWSVMKVRDYVEVHLFARPISVEVKPPYFYKMVKTLKRVIDSERKLLVPPVVFTVESDRPATPENHQVEFWHHIVVVRATYMLRVIEPSA